MTTSPSYERVYDRLKGAMPAWRSLTETSVADLTALIADAGLSGQRALRLKQIADRLSDDFGDISLAAVAHLDDDAAQQYLTSLPGVGVKTAKCVMMYSLGRQVLPVDTHTARVATRLALVSTGSAAAIDRDLSDVVPATLRFDFHVNAVAHGRAVCRAVRPRCDDCVLSSLCPVGRTANRSSRRRRNVTVVIGVTFVLPTTRSILRFLTEASPHDPSKGTPGRHGCATASTLPTARWEGAASHPR